VPSKIDSPIWGMITSVGMAPSLHDSGQKCRPRHKADYKSQGVCWWRGLAEGWAQELNSGVLSLKFIL